MALRIPLFWRFQIVGWLMFLIATFPLKWVVLGSFQSALIVSFYRESLGFLTTWGMREAYRRIFNEKMDLRSLFLLVLSVSLAGGFLQTILCLSFHDMFDFEEDKIFKNMVVFGILYFRTILCLTWSFLYFGIVLWRMKTERDFRLRDERAERREIELQMLRAQINPHFLFNALNTILVALEKKRKRVSEMLQALSDYLNYALTHTNDDFVLLGDESDALLDYLVLERARLGDELDVECGIDPKARGVLVPGVLLQPLVENAIKYGRETWSPPVIVRIKVALEEPNLLIEVFNTGRWVEADTSRKSGGVGLENIRRRLEWLYPGKHQMEITPEDGWVAIQIRIPLQP